MLREARALEIACGALAHEVSELKRVNGWTSFDVQCLPPELHNRPEKIAPAVREKIRENRERYPHIFVAYADCGTGGELDRVLAAEQVERLPGAHCYEFFAGSKAFAAMAEDEPGTFYLTDFLLRHFDDFGYQPDLSLFLIQEHVADEVRVLRGVFCREQCLFGQFVFG